MITSSSKEFKASPGEDWINRCPPVPSDCESGFEFSKNGKEIIFDENSENFEITLEKIENFISVTRNLLSGTNRNFRAF